MLLLRGDGMYSLESKISDEAFILKIHLIDHDTLPKMLRN